MFLFNFDPVQLRNFVTNIDSFETAAQKLDDLRAAIPLVNPVSGPFVDTLHKRRRIIRILTYLSRLRVMCYDAATEVMSPDQVIAFCDEKQLKLEREYGTKLKLRLPNSLETVLNDTEFNSKYIREYLDVAIAAMLVLMQNIVAANRALTKLPGEAGKPRFRIAFLRYLMASASFVLQTFEEDLNHHETSSMKWARRQVMHRAAKKVRSQ